MDDHVKADEERIGFLAATSPSGNVFLGGLLITTRLGRPLEFQCTAPVEPNPTQVLLYGPTLKPYVLNELIGRTLLERVSLSPHVLLVDDPQLLDLRHVAKQPVACVCDLGQSHTMKVGRNGLLLHREDLDDLATFTSACSQIPQDADVAEPFERVRAALKEAMGTAAATNRGAA
jgi:hypothetical protein